MTLQSKEVGLVLSEDAREVLERIGLDVPESPMVNVKVEETDDLGIWIRNKRADGDHVALVRWEYVLAIDFLPSEARKVGLRG